MKYYKKESINITIAEALLTMSNIVTFALLWWQKTQLEKQQQNVTALELELKRMNGKVMELEQQALLLREKTEILHSTSPLVTELQSSYLTSSLMYWCLGILVLVVTLHLGSVFYAKIFKISLWSFLPKMQIPYYLIPYLNNTSKFEFIVGEHTIRFMVKGGNVVSAEGKSLGDMGYVPLEEVLNRGSQIGFDILTKANALMLDSVSVLSSKSAPVILTKTQQALTTPGIVEKIDTMSTILNVIW